MSRLASAVSDALLRTTIDQSGRLGGASLVRLDRRASEYATSCPLEEVTIALNDGTERRLMLKHLGPMARSEQVARHKPSFLLDADREILVYRHVLAPRGIGATFYGASPPGTPWPWLLVEKIDGVEMYQIGELDAWRAAASWLGTLHASLPRTAALALPIANRLLQFDRSSCLQWIDRCRAFFATTAPASSSAATTLQWLATRFETVIDYLMDMPHSFIHGEFYASNVLAQGGPTGWRTVPIDWEMASIGPAVLDVAALTSGDWSDTAKTFIVDGYRQSAAAGGFATTDLSESVDYAQLYLAIQWLGWFGRRHPPTQHARDWLADAARLAEKLKL